MKRSLWLLLLLISGSISRAQDKEAADTLVAAGVDHHDKGEYDSALAKFDRALELDKNNLAALAEKAVTLVSLQKYDESIQYCEKAMETHPGDKELYVVYVAYGNAADALQKTDLAIKVYNQGIKQFPDYYQLYFNKGVSLSGLQKYDDAMLCFQKAVQLQPAHASSHNAIARIAGINGKKIPSLLAYCRFLTLEQESSRAKENLASVQHMMKGNAKKTGDNSVTINLSADMLSGASKKGKQKENDFSMVDMMLSLDAALDYDDKYKNQTEVQQFIRKFDDMCAVLGEGGKNSGFFWDYYAPYLAAMKEKKFAEPFAYQAFGASGNPDVLAWLKDHSTDVEKFSAWSAQFEWKKK